MQKEKLVIKGAREHNLRNIDVEIPRNTLTVITGLSGSGKSSLAFDTIYAEGQRRYVESLSAYARQFLGLMEKPDVDYIDGLSPAISIEQRSTAKNPRSTVGTVTEIHDYLRLLFARIGQPFCYKCGRKIDRQTVQQVVDAILGLPARTRIQILAPIVRGRKGEYRELFRQIKKDGFLRVRIDGTIHDLDEDITLSKNIKHDIEVVVDRLVIDAKIANRLADSIQTAFNLSSGILKVDMPGSDKKELLFSEKLACYHCGLSYEEVSPRMFSFNSPYGACKECDGLGVKLEIDSDLVVPNPRYSLRQGAIEAWGNFEGRHWEQILKGIARKYAFDFKTPFQDLPKRVQNIILYGSDKEQFKVQYKSRTGKWQGEYTNRFEGVIPNLMRRYRETKSEDMRTWIQGFMSAKTCPACKGARLREESLAIKIDGHSIAEVSSWSIKALQAYFEGLHLSERDMKIGHQVLKEIRERLGFLVNVGLDYLTLDRAANTLSGGEAQRIRLATQIGSQLVGVLYVLDEPSIGLHQRDNQRLLDTLLQLRDLGNTVIVVEHDRATIEHADHIIDLGPGAGVAGGRVVAAGSPAQLKKIPASLTGRYLADKAGIPVPQKRRPAGKNRISVVGASEHNLRSVTAHFPLGCFICVTGVSGSGKSTLVNETLSRALASHLYHAKDHPGKHRRINGLQHIDKVINIDQSPIGRTPRSNPATYTGTFTYIRDLFSQLPEAKIRGYQPGRFSFNVRGGRCEACEGDGIIKIEMHFLPDVYVPCEVCKGRRYNRETLEIRYRGKSIADVLDMTVDEAFDFFQNIPRIKRKLETLKRVGLGYIHLGQAATTLSGGEAQRIKLSTELSKRSTGRTFYILDEPTTGLHFEDIKLLLTVLHELVENGNTVVVIEHNLDVIKTADQIIDLGPEGGDGGGSIVAAGTPEEVAAVRESYTGRFLKEELAG